MQQITVEAIPAFIDNYIWALRRGAQVVLVDPGDARVVEDYLERTGGQLAAILITHHHGDHTGGVDALTARRGDVAVYGPSLRPIPGVNRPLRGGERIALEALGVTFDVWATPGHTLDHLVYVGAEAVFCGDTLFAAGCGRLFEGTGEQLFDALMRLSTLPDATRIYCAHEYTLANLRFAQAVEPHHSALQERIARESARRARGEPTLPSVLALERETNPFLRCHREEVAERVRVMRGIATDDPAQVFIALRRWKDEFR